MKRIALFVKIRLCFYFIYLCVAGQSVCRFFGGTYLHLDEAPYFLMLDPDWRAGLTVITEWWLKKITVL